MFKKKKSHNYTENLALVNKYLDKITKTLEHDVQNTLDYCEKQLEKLNSLTILNIILLVLLGFGLALILLGSV